MLKLYVLIRDDISPAQQAVQAGHAIAQFGYDYQQAFRDWQEDNNTLIYLSVRGIDRWVTALSDGMFIHSVFMEPDLDSVTETAWKDVRAGGVPTAIAVAPNWLTQYVLFKDLPLALRDVEKRKRWWQ